MSDFHCSYEVGDRLRIRSWEDMEQEFGLNDLGDIACRFAFTKSMRYLCGKEFTVSDKIGESFRSVEGIGGVWSISADMLEPIPSETELKSSSDCCMKTCSKKSFMEFLKTYTTVE